MSNPKPIPVFLPETQWNYRVWSSETLTGSNTGRQLILKALENTVIKYASVFNTNIDPSDQNYVYVKPQLAMTACVIKCGWANNWHDMICDTEFVVPNNHYLGLMGNALPTLKVGFMVVYKGNLIDISDAQGVI